MSQLNQDITVGKTTVKAHEKTGWALPGGKQTSDRDEAIRVALAIQALGSPGSRPVRIAISPAETTHRVVVRRKTRNSRYSIL